MNSGLHHEDMAQIKRGPTLRADPRPRPRDPEILLYNGTSRQWLTQFSRRPQNVFEELESICVFSAAIKDISIRVKQIVNCLKTFACN